MFSGHQPNPATQRMLASPHIEEVTPFGMDGYRYCYSVNKVFFADSLEAAKAGYRVLTALPPPVAEMLVKDVQEKGLFILLKTPEEGVLSKLGVQRGIWSFDMDYNASGRGNLRDWMRSVKQALFGSGVDKVFDGEKIEVFVHSNPLSTKVAVAHELGHHYWFQHNYELASQKGYTLGQGQFSPSELSDSFFHPGAKLMGRRLPRSGLSVYLKEVKKFLKQYHLRSVFQLDSSSAVPSGGEYLFGSPFVYFRDSLTSRMEALIGNGSQYELNADLLAEVERLAYLKKGKPLLFLVSELKRLHPEVPVTKIRHAVSEAALFMRQELGAFVFQMEATYPGSVKRLMPKTFAVFERLAGAQSIDKFRVPFAIKQLTYTLDGKMLRLPGPLEFNAGSIKTMPLKRLPDYTPTLALPDYYTPQLKSKPQFPSPDYPYPGDKIGYAGMGRRLLQKAGIGLFALDGYFRYQHEQAHYPLVTRGAHVGAAAARIGIDMAMFEGLHHFMRPMSAIGSAVLLNELSRVAYEARHITPQDLMNKRDALTGLMDVYELSEELQRHLLADFDEGGHKSRQFIASAYHSGLPLQKTLEYLHRGKEGLVSVVRAFGDMLRVPTESGPLKWIYHVAQASYPPIAFLGMLGREDTLIVDQHPEPALSHRYRMSELKINFLESAHEMSVGPLYNYNPYEVNDMMRKGEILPVRCILGEASDEQSVREGRYREVIPSINEKGVQAVEEAFRLIERIGRLSEGFVAPRNEQETRPASPYDINFDVGTVVGAVIVGLVAIFNRKKNKEDRVDPNAESRSQAVTLETFYQSLHRSYQSYRSVEINSEYYDRYLRELMDQVGIAERLFKVNPLEYLFSDIHAISPTAFSRALSAKSVSSAWQLDFMENRGLLEGIGAELKDVKGEIARYKTHQEGYGDIQGNLAMLANEINARIAALLSNPALQFLNDYAGLNRYVRDEVEKENAKGRKNKVHSKDKKKGKEMDEMAADAEKAERELHEALELLKNEDAKLRRVSHVAIEVKDNKSRVGLNLKHLEGHYFDLQMQKINLSAFYSSPDATLNAIRDLHGELTEKNARKKEEYDGLDVKKQAWEAELAEEQGKPPEKQDPIKIQQLKSDIESAKAGLGDIEHEQKVIAEDMASLQRQQARVERQKPIRQEIYDMKMGAIKRKFPGMSDREIEEYLSDQSLFDESYQLTLKNIYDETHGYRSLIGSASQLVSSVISFMGHKAGCSWVTPEMQTTLNGVIHCAEGIFDIGVTIANISASIGRAMEGGFGVQNVLATIVSPGIGIFNVLFGFVRGLKPLPDPVLENLKVISKNMAENFQVIASGIDHLGKMMEFSFEQNKAIIALLREGFYQLSLAEENRGISQENRLIEIKRQLERQVFAKIVKPNHQVMTEARRIHKDLKESLKFSDSEHRLQKKVAELNGVLVQDTTAAVSRRYKPYRDSHSGMMFTNANGLIGPHLKRAGVGSGKQPKHALKPMLKLNDVMIKQAGHILRLILEGLKSSGRVGIEDKYSNLLARLSAESALSESKVLLAAYRDLKHVDVFRHAYLDVIQAVNLCNDLMEKSVLDAAALDVSGNNAPRGQYLDGFGRQARRHQFSDTQVMLAGSLSVPLSQANVEKSQSFQRVWVNDYFKGRFEASIRRHENETAGYYGAMYEQVTTFSTWQPLAMFSTGRADKPKFYSLRYGKADPSRREEYIHQAALFSGLSDGTPPPYAMIGGNAGEQAGSDRHDYEAHFFNAPHRYYYRLGGLGYRHRLVSKAGDVNTAYSRIPLVSVLRRPAIGLSDGVTKHTLEWGEQNLNCVQDDLDLLKPLMVDASERARVLSQIDRQAHKDELAKDVFHAFALGLMTPDDQCYADVFKRFESVAQSKAQHTELRNAYASTMSDREMLDYCALYTERYLDAVTAGEIPMSLSLIRMVNVGSDSIGYYLGDDATDSGTIPKLSYKKLDLYAPWFNPFLVDVLRNYALTEAYYNQHVERLIHKYNACIHYLEVGSVGTLSEAECNLLKGEAQLIYAEGNRAESLVPLVVKQAELHGFVKRYLECLYQRQPGYRVHPDAKFLFQYVVDDVADREHAMVGLHAYIQSQDGTLQRLTTEGVIPYREINKQTLFYYVSKSSVILGERFDFNLSDQLHRQALNMVLVSLQSPLMEGFILAEASTRKVKEVSAVSRYYRYKGEQGDRFEDNFDMWEGTRADVTLFNPANLPVPKIKRFPGLFQVNATLGQTVVYAHHAFDANLASTWAHPALQKASLLSDNIKPISEAVFMKMALPAKRDLLVIRDDRSIDSATLALKKSLYALMGLFALAGDDIDQHKDVFDRLCLNLLLSVVEHHGAEHELEHFANVVLYFVRCNGKENALLDVLIDYHGQVIAKNSPRKLEQLVKQVNSLSLLAETQQGLFRKKAAHAVVSDDDSGVLRVRRQGAH